MSEAFWPAGSNDRRLTVGLPTVGIASPMGAGSANLSTHVCLSYRSPPGFLVAPPNPNGVSGNSNGPIKGPTLEQLSSASRRQNTSLPVRPFDSFGQPATPIPRKSDGSLILLTCLIAFSLLSTSTGHYPVLLQQGFYYDAIETFPDSSRRVPLPAVGDVDDDDGHCGTVRGLCVVPWPPCLSSFQSSSLGRFLSRRPIQW